MLRPWPASQAMSDLYRYSGEAGYSEEMLERCLYALETAWHPGFNPVTSACQLDYMEERNRPLFTALFRHMMVSAQPAPAPSSKPCAQSIIVCLNAFCTSADGVNLASGLHHTYS